MNYGMVDRVKRSVLKKYGHIRQGVHRTDRLRNCDVCGMPGVGNSVDQKVEDF